MSGQTLRPQPANRLLLGEPGFRFHCTDRGILWYADAYGITRVEVFKAAPAATSRGVQLVRSMLDRLRAETVIGELRQTKYFVDVSGPASRLVCSGPIAVVVNSRLWDAWHKTGLTPSLTTRGTILWHGQVRGKTALFGAFMPIHIGPYAPSAASTEER